MRDIWSWLLHRVGVQAWRDKTDGFDTSSYDKAYHSIILDAIIRALGDLLWFLGESSLTCTYFELQHDPLKH